MGEWNNHIVTTVCIDVSLHDDPAAALGALIPDTEFAFVILLVTPKIEIEPFLAEVSKTITAAHIIGARTAGEICEIGYAEGRIVFVGFPKSHFAASAKVFEFQKQTDGFHHARDVLALRQDVQTQVPEFENEFAFLLVDGMSRREDALVADISTALGSTQLFGGSSGDGLRFEHAPVFHNGNVREDAAILLVARTNCDVKIFREDHFVPSEKKLVVTGAVPEERLVMEINAEPAAREYARIVGIDPDQLSPFIFASHPIVVKIGEQHHVRAIQKVEDNKYLRFFSSIDEGMVLTVADANNIRDHLEGVLERLNREQKPDLIFACDCILRRLEAEQKQEKPAMSALLRDHRVVGFSTYGEQHNMLHVNQTLTGLAIYPPKELS